MVYILNNVFKFNITLLVFLLMLMPATFPMNQIDFDPLMDVIVTVKINEVRFLEDNNLEEDTTFYIVVTINNEIFKSKIWNDTRYLYGINWTVSLNVPDDNEYVSIILQLWDCSNGTDKLCDINPNKDYNQAEIIYSICSGHWSGDDYIGDLSGYGRLNGCDDGSIYENERDCELCFDIYQNDFDNDNIPYYYEENVYLTNPEFNDVGSDCDNDKIPIEWEHRWGYDPNLWDDHVNLDPDLDGIQNYEEFLTSDWDSDPFRKDLFIEIDEMQESPDGLSSKVPNNSKELVRNVYCRRNILLHIDDGCMGGGGETIPFDRVTGGVDLFFIYYRYFLHNNFHNWRRGVFRYCMSIYHHVTASGIAYVGEMPFLYWHAKGTNTYQISSTSIQQISEYNYKSLDFIYACIILHETCHTMGIDLLFPLGCDNKRTMYPWRISYWIFQNYKSVMNYRYVWEILDYSDGSHGKGDYNDWDNLDLTFFCLK